MKIGLYLQDINENRKNIKVFNKAMTDVKKSDIDLLIFPECCYTPFANDLYSIDISSDNGHLQVEDYCMELSKSVGCAVIFSSKDREDTIYSIYVNAFSKDEETFSKLYIKHTATNYSAFEFSDYGKIIELMFDPIIYKGLKIGMTICYDCNHALFSRVYGHNGIDILINSTGGNIVYDKWHKYNKVRAIENRCFNFCTMGYTGDYKRINSYVFGYSPNGKAMDFMNLSYIGNDRNKVGTIYIYDTDRDDETFDEDTSIGQTATTNHIENFFFPYGRACELISKSKEIDKNLYIYTKETENIVFCIVTGKEILEPEKVLHLLYHKNLKNIKNKRYIIVNQWRHLSEELYKYQISDILKVRSMENYCAVILESDTRNKCYQCGKNRTAQVVKDVDGKYGIDLSRTTGPEAIWKNKYGMRAKWREGFEILLNYLESK